MCLRWDTELLSGLKITVYNSQLEKPSSLLPSIFLVHTDLEKVLKYHVT